MAVETVIGTPSAEEQTLIALRDSEYAHVATALLDDLGRGESPRILAVARPDHLYGVARELWLPAVTAPDTLATGYKAGLFDQFADIAASGDPAAISMLPKLVTTMGQLATTIELTMDNRDTVSEWRTGKKYVQYIGSFNPQHTGHRTSIATTIDAAGPRASAIVQVVADHPIKKDELPPYRDRFAPGERKLYSSSLLDPTLVTPLDVPLSLGLAKVGVAQIRLLADVMGDKMRWQVGSDKFIKDVIDVQSGKSREKAGVRFSGVHLYVARRDTETIEQIAAATTYLHENYGARVTILPEHEAAVQDAAASKIRAMRATGEHEAADQMEFADIHPAVAAEMGTLARVDYLGRVAVK